MDRCELKRFYRQNRDVIRRRLGEFKKVLEGSDKELSAELCFCLCTPQTKAKKAWNDAICPLAGCGELYSGKEEDVARFLKAAGVRFHKTKAGRIVLARKQFAGGGLRELIRGFESQGELRDCLAEKVKGLGMKEASHFLRNIGLGDELAILDRHILKNLTALGVISEIPGNLSAQRYRKIESKMRDFSEEMEIPLDELDLLLWMHETGEVFK